MSLNPAWGAEKKSQSLVVSASKPIADLLKLFAFLCVPIGHLVAAS